MGRYFSSEISDFSKKYLMYVGWKESRNVILDEVVKELKRWHWQGELPKIWYDICSSIEDLPPLTVHSGIPRATAEADNFRGWDMYFSAHSGSNFAWVSEEMRVHFGGNFGPLGMFPVDALLVVDDDARFYTYNEGRVLIYDQGVRNGFDSLLLGRPVDEAKLPYSCDDWEDRFPNPL